MKMVVTILKFQINRGELLFLSADFHSFASVKFLFLRRTTKNLFEKPFHTLFECVSKISVEKSFSKVFSIISLLTDPRPQDEWLQVHNTSSKYDLSRKEHCRSPTYPLQFVDHKILKLYCGRTLPFLHIL